MSSSGQYGLPESGNKSQFQNIGGMKSQGLELAINTDTTKTLAFNLAYTYIDAEFTKYDNYNLVLGNPYDNPTIEPYDLTGNDIPRVSNHHVNISMDYNVNNNFKISSELDAVSDYYADELNWHKIPGHGTVNLITSYNDKFADYEISMFARVDNLFDKTYYNSARGYRDSDEDDDYDAEDLSLTVNEGRVLTAGLSAKF
jgi:iron complex outermembrane receptor protein